MDEKSDYLALWMHYESRGYDDKNRMIASATLLIGVSGVLFSAAVTWLTASPSKPWASGLMAALSIAVALLALILVGFFAQHAERNFRSAKYIRDTYLGPAGGPTPVGKLLDEVDKEQKNTPHVGLLGDWHWLSEHLEGKQVGRIFSVFSWISGLMVVPPLILMLRGC